MLSIYYNFKIKDSISLLLIEDLFEKVFNKLRLALREKIDDTIIFTFIIIKTRYNLKHLSLYLKLENKIFLILYHKYSILNLTNKKLF